MGKLGFRRRVVGLGPVAPIANENLRTPSESGEFIQRGVRHGFALVEQRDFERRPERSERARHAQQELSIGAGFDQAVGRTVPGKIPQRAREDSGIAHQSVHAAEIAARALRARVVGRQQVEQLGLDDPFHGPATSSNAPWQLNPAPKDDIHHKPSGTLPWSAACKTNKTKSNASKPGARPFTVKRQQRWDWFREKQFSSPTL